MECSFSFYNFTVLLELACSVALIINSIFINQWRYHQITELND